MAQYRYARNDKGVLYDIEDVTPDIRKNTNFFCVGCGCSMRAGLGKVREHYFAHQNSDAERQCNQETYLHKLGKRKFLELYQLHKANGTRMAVAFRCPSVCDVSDCPYGQTEPCRNSVVEMYELYPRYSQAVEEEWDEIYKPDIRLTNEAGETLFIEIFVTHPCSEEKINYGVPIIEFSLQSDEDLNVISDEAMADVDNPQIEFYNAPSEPVVVPPTCTEKVEKARIAFRDEHQRSVKSNTELLLPYTIKHICPDKECPFLKQPGCSCYEAHKNIDLTEALPYVDETNGLVLTNGRKRLKIDMVFKFNERNQYPEGVQAAQYLVDDVLKGDFDRVKYFNFTSSRTCRACEDCEYILIVQREDEGIQAYKENHLPQVYELFKQVKSGILSYILVNVDEFKRKVEFVEWDDPNIFNAMLYKASVGYFAGGASVKSCFLCRHMTDNKYRSQNSNQPIYCFATHSRCDSTQACCCDRFEPDRRHWLKLVRFEDWQEALSECCAETMWFKDE